MKNIRTFKILLISLLTMLVLSIIGLTYAYFSLEIEGTGKDISMIAGDLRLIYKDETDLKLTDVMPGDEVSKVITVTNPSLRSAKYSLYWGDLINTIDYFELHVTLECKSYINYGESNQEESGTCEEIYRAVPISDTVTTGNIKKGISIEPGITQEYTVTVKFDNKTYPQNDNLNKSFTGKIGIEEYTDPEIVKCSFDGEMVQGAEYVNGQYTYRYMQEGGYSYYNTNAWEEIDIDGWGVQLTDKTSTDPVTSRICDYINDKPLVSISRIFYKSQTTSIDLGSFAGENVTKTVLAFNTSTVTEIKGLGNLITSNVTDMSSMFLDNSASTLDLSNFDTSNVTDMVSMFSGTNVISLDLSSFNTSNVTGMNGMFSGSTVEKVDLSSFDTSNVTDMSWMFSSSKLSKLDVSNFDTCNVTRMTYMFNAIPTNYLNLNNFNTSKVTKMDGMFRNTHVRYLNLSSFDTSNVTTMEYMFYYSYSYHINLSSFDTSNVKIMNNMFRHLYYSKNIDLSSFNTSNVTGMSYMFAESQFELLDLSSFDTSNVTTMEGMFKSSTVKEIKGYDKFDTKKVRNMSFMFASSKLETLDLRNFDTSSVTTMEAMFMDTSSKIIGLNNFNTSKVTRMNQMFRGSSSNVDLSNFDTSSVINMSNMFQKYKCASLNLSSFDTSNVTDMSRMFDSSTITELKGLDKFDTRNVVNMQTMFRLVQFTTLDLSNFDTSKVTNMSEMFYNNKNLTTIYASDKFVTDSVTSSTSMFYNNTNLVGGAGTAYNRSYTDKTYARVDGGTSSPGYFTLKSS